MIQLLLLDDPRLAQSLADYLASRGVRCELRQSELGTALWLADASRLAEAESEVTRFLREPWHPRYAEASWRSGQADTRIDYSAGSPSLLAQFLLQAGPLTLTLLLLCLLVFGLQWLFGRTLLDWLGFYTSWEALGGWQLWRMLTPALLHFSMLHLLFNLLWWWYLGGMVERTRGSGKLLTLLLAGAVLSHLLQFALVGPYFGGLSGVVYALVGYVWLQGRLNRRPELAIPDALFGFMLAWLVLGFFDVLGSATANLAHLGGLLAGLLLAGLDGRRVSGR